MITIRAIAALTTATLLLGACGVPAQDESHPVTLPRRPLNTSTPAANQPPGEVAQILCLTRGNHLTQTVRRVDATPDPQRHLDLLVAGPTPAEQEQGLSTALATTELTVTLPAGASTATVEVREPDETTARSDEVLAYGQIVCTLTARAEITAVAFTRDGHPLQVPRGDLTLTEEPLRASDYRTLLQPA